MRRQKIFYILISLVVALMTWEIASAYAQTIRGKQIKKGIWMGGDIEYVDGEILLKVLEATTSQQLQELFARHSVLSQQDMLLPRWKRITVSSNANLFAIIEALRNEPRIETAEPNGIFYISDTTPNDPEFAPKQWGLKNTGQAPNGITGADIKATQAWDVTTGTSNIIVAVLDTGIPLVNGQLSHPDLNDPNKYILGFDFIDDENDPNADLTVRDEEGHGTHVTGIIAAMTNNATGVAGVAWGVKILAIQVAKPGDWFAEADWNAVANGITYAVNNGAKVINYSGGGYPNPDPVSVTDAIVFANQNNALFVAAAGNIFKYTTVQYPARLSPTHPNVVAVTATNHRDEFASSYSVSGPEVNVAAPGGHGGTKDADDIYSTFPDYQVPNRPLYYGYNYGTSMAAPHVSGVAALIYSINPSISAASARSILETTADDKGPSGRDNQYGWGRINARAAVIKALDELTTRTSISTLATTGNNGRKMVKNGSNYYLVYASGNQIYFTQSTDNGSTWSDPPTRLTDGFGQNKYPCIAERGNNLYVVWQRRLSSTAVKLYVRTSSNGGSSWNNAYILKSLPSTTIDPLPVITASSPTAGFEMIVVYRTTSNLTSLRTTTSLPADSTIWGSVIVSGTNSNSRNSSLVYKSDGGPNYFRLTWDDGNNVYHQAFNGSSWSTPAYRVSNPDGAAYNQYSSYALSGNLDRHIVWQAYDFDVYLKQVIYHNKNLNSSVFTVFASYDGDFLRPTGSGHSGGAFSVVWHDASSNKNIRKAYYNGSSWTDGQAGTIIASNGADASLSVVNPPGANAKAVWRSTETVPYTLTVGPSGGLGKSAASEIFVYNRRAVYSLDTTAVFVLQMDTPQLISGGSNSALSFPTVADDDSLVAAQLAEKLSLSNIPLPADADSVVFTVHHYSRDAGQLRQNLQQPLQVAFVLSPTTGATPITISLGSISPTGESRQATRVAFPAQSWRNQTVNLQTVISNLDVSKSLGTLIHVYEAIQSGVSKSNSQPTATVTDDQPSLTVHVHPNPFNPSTRIHFGIPAEGSVALRIYNLYGQLVRELLHEYRAAGEYTMIWDGRDDRGIAAASGVYFIRFEAGNEVKVSKVMLVR